MLVQHCNNVSKICFNIGKALKLNENELYELRLAAIYHDIGKFKIPPEILNKPSKLTYEEMEEMKKHSIYGFNMAKEIGLSKTICKAILYHHEKYDGGGYPEGRYRNNIPLFSRIIAVADSFDAMTSKRPYNTPKTTREALNEIGQNQYGQFDFRIVEIFLKNEKTILTLDNKYNKIKLNSVELNSVKLN